MTFQMASSDCLFSPSREREKKKVVLRDHFPSNRGYIELMGAVDEAIAAASIYNTSTHHDSSLLYLCVCGCLSSFFLVEAQGRPHKIQKRSKNQREPLFCDTWMRTEMWRRIAKLRGRVSKENLKRHALYRQSRNNSRSHLKVMYNE